MNLSKIRQDTDGFLHVVHLNSAGCSLPPNSIRDTVIDYLQEEALFGGYEMEAKYRDDLEAVYDSIAQFIHAKNTEIALVKNATVAWNMALYSIDWQKGDEIITTEYSYSSNFINFLKLQKERGIVIKIVSTDLLGNIDLDQMNRLVSPKTKLIALTWVPTNSGIINPAVEVGKIAQEKEVMYLLDACQTVGQLPVNVQELNCSFLSATGRKFLRAPRGTGFLYVNENVLEKVNPIWLDTYAADWTTVGGYVIRKTARKFENWENNKALRLGLGKAVEYAMEVGIEDSWARIQNLSAYCRNKLAELPDIQLLDPGTNKSGIITLTHRSISPSILQQFLQKNKINTSVSRKQGALLDAQKRGLENMLRISVHYFNLEEEVDLLVESLYKKKK